MTMKKRILAGITKDNELYFLDIEIRKDGSLSICGDTNLPIRKSEAVERCREILEDDREQWKMAVEADQTTLGQQEWADYVLSVDGELAGFDNSLFDEEVEVGSEAWLFESVGAGQHEEESLKHYFINENLFKQLMKIWKRYHLKVLPENSAMSIIEETKEIKQDFNALAVEAVKIITGDESRK
jgi:hypothetical protein